MEIVSPDSVGMSTTQLAEINTAMQGFIDAGKIPGISTLVARHGQVVHFECSGLSEPATGKPVRHDSIFRIYSLTKPITAAAVLSLLDEGRFLLDDPVANWIPAFHDLRVLQGDTSVPLEREITIRHLLTHTAGLGYGFMAGPLEERYREAALFSTHLVLLVDLHELIERVTRLPLLAQPGETWHYSVAHDVLGYLIEQVSGRSFGEFLRERIFQPLGMVDTGFFVPPEKLDRFGPMYSENGLVVDAVSNSSFTRADNPPSGGAGLVSTIPDYFRFLAMLANGGVYNGARVLRQETAVAMMENQLKGSTYPVRFDDNPWSGMGYGLGIGVQVEGAPQIGWVGLSGTTAWIHPVEDLIFIAMPQVFGDSESGNTAQQLALQAVL